MASKTETSLDRDVGSLGFKTLIFFIAVFILIFILGTAVFVKILQSRSIVEEEINNFAEVALEQNMIVLQNLGSDLIKQIAKDVAVELEIYIRAHPDMTLKDLQADQEFSALAVQPVGKTGYTAVTDVDSLVCRFHSNPAIVNLDLHMLSEKLPGFWKIMELSEGGFESEGFYDWLEADGSIEKKYMYIAILNEPTADGIILSVAATAYMDEYIKPLEPARSAIVSSNNIVNERLDYYYQVLYGLMGLIFFTLLGLSIIGLFIVDFRISKPINTLYKMTEKIRKGDFSARTHLKTGDEIEKLSEALNSTTEALSHLDAEHKEIDKTKTRFLSITSHELRSPMTPMKAQLQMLLGNYFGKLTKKQKGAIDIVLRNTNRLDNIITDFLEISRIEAARLKFKFVKANLAEHINRLVDEMNGFMMEKKIKIESNVGKLPDILVDPDRTMQVLRNLINNAKKFSPEGKTVFVEAKLVGNMIQMSVEDQGIGVSKEDQRKLFEPFYQAEQTIYREHGGTGLGLAICRGIVEAQNGKIWMESVVGKGTKFFFTVPLEPVKDIKPIRVLFSEEASTSREISKNFRTFLGPIGVTEFEDLVKKDGLKKDKILSYINSLEKKGILNHEKAEVFKNNLIHILSGQKTGHKDQKITAETSVASFFEGSSEKDKQEADNDDPVSEDSQKTPVTDKKSKKSVDKKEGEANGL